MAQTTTSRFAMAIAVLLPVLSSSGGCAKISMHDLRHYHQHVMRQGADLVVEPGCYGYHPTCWRPWPGGCQPCPPYAAMQGAAPGPLEIPANGSETIPVPATTGNRLPEAAPLPWDSVPEPLPQLAPADPTEPAAGELEEPAIEIPKEGQDPPREEPPEPLPGMSTWRANPARGGLARFLSPIAMALQPDGLTLPAVIRPELPQGAPRAGADRGSPGEAMVEPREDPASQVVWVSSLD